MNRLAIVMVMVISLVTGASIDSTKLDYFVGGVLFTVAVEGLVKIINALARRFSKPAVHGV